MASAQLDWEKCGVVAKVVTMISNRLDISTEQRLHERCRPALPEKDACLGVFWAGTVSCRRASLSWVTDAPTFRAPCSRLNKTKFVFNGVGIFSFVTACVTAQLHDRRC